MNWIENLQNVDIYLIDQILKGRISKNDRILDAGCGKGRNLRPFIENKFDFIGFDPNEERIALLKETYPADQRRFILATIESFYTSHKFNFIICNAVLHFAKNETEFDEQFSKLVDLLDEGGILFIRMTTTIGMNYSETGVHHLSDETTRFLITREKIDTLLTVSGLELIDPVKSTLVEDLRSMTTIVARKTNLKASISSKL
jgi:2-polyprenyl-3-methyl-5-hydroxy-6-metoxy-1,4-benzoquinol methylase